MELIEPPRKAQPFTKENAAEMARRAHAARREREEERARILEALPANASERTRHERILQQMDEVDRWINRASDAMELVALIRSKDTLYHMLFPRRGSLKPRPDKRVQPPTIDAGTWQPVNESTNTP